MPPRLPTPTRRLLAARIPLLSPPPLSRLQQPPPHLAQVQAHPAQPKPTTTTTTTTRPLSTTAPRPWLLSALPNLTPGGTSHRPPAPKTLHARRLLPYPPAHVYTLIADIDSYTHFLPHCPHSRVTRWTSPKPTANSPTASSASASGAGASGAGKDGKRRHPALADLTVGWGPFTQTYTSRVYCVPGSVVEAVSGSAETSIPADVLRSVGYGESEIQGGGEGKKMEGIFESLVTRWTVKPVVQETGGEWSEVTLSVTFQFANPALGFAVGQLADEKVDEMVAAFEGRARELYGGR